MLISRMCNLCPLVELSNAVVGEAGPVSKLKYTYQILKQRPNRICLQLAGCCCRLFVSCRPVCTFEESSILEFACKSFVLFPLPTQYIRSCHTSMSEIRCVRPSDVEDRTHGGRISEALRTFCFEPVLPCCVIKSKRIPSIPCHTDTRPLKLLSLCCIIFLHTTTTTNICLWPNISLCSSKNSTFTGQILVKSSSSSPSACCQRFCPMT